MSWRYAGLSLIIIIITCVRYVIISTHPKELIPETWLTPQSDFDPEGYLAMGRKLPLGCADMWSLELIKGISDTLATELLRKRSRILSAAATADHHTALQLAHGIGEKKSSEMLRYLELSNDCAPGDRYEEFAGSGSKWISREDE